VAARARGLVAARARGQVAGRARAQVAGRAQVPPGPAHPEGRAAAEAGMAAA